MIKAEEVRQSILELKILTHCRCDDAYKGRGLQDPDCQCDYKDDVNIIEEYVEKTLTKRSNPNRGDLS